MTAVTASPRVVFGTLAFPLVPVAPLRPRLACWLSCRSGPSAA